MWGSAEMPVWKDKHLLLLLSYDFGQARGRWKNHWMMGRRLHWSLIRECPPQEDSGENSSAAQSGRKFDPALSSFASRTPRTVKLKSYWHSSLQMCGMFSVHWSKAQLGWYSCVHEECWARAPVTTNHSQHTGILPAIYQLCWSCCKAHDKLRYIWKPKTWNPVMAKEFYLSWKLTLLSCKKVWKISIFRALN